MQLGGWLNWLKQFVLDFFWSDFFEYLSISVTVFSVLFIMLWALDHFMWHGNIGK